MINPYEWSDYYLLVTIRNRSSPMAYLVNHLSQEEVIERYTDQMTGPASDVRNVKIIEMNVQPLTEDSYNLLEEYYGDSYKLG